MALNWSVIDSTAVTLLRADLAAANFGTDALTALWGRAGDAALRRGHRAPAVRALDAESSDSPVATLARMFVLGLPADAAALAAALPSFGVEGAAAGGLVTSSEANSVAPLVELKPHDFVDSRGVGSWWIASDLSEMATQGPLRRDHVLGVGGASATLTGLMMRAPVESVLDLGTGCGIQAMHAARHAARVVATDISSRALDFARLNAELNGISTIEFRLGSLFEPVAGERFDQIVSNPPFVITPRSADVPEYEYRDGGRVGDDLVADVVRGVTDHLVPGGVAQLLGNWENRDGQNGADRVAGWAEGTDLWLVERETQDVSLYAETWIRDGGTKPGPAFDALHRAWLDDFAARRVTSVGFGYLTVRRPVGEPSMTRIERLGGPLGNGALGAQTAGSGVAGLGDHILDGLAAHDWLREHDDEALGEVHLTLAPDVTEERHYWPGDEHPTVMTLRQGAGFAREFPLGTALAAFVGACDGDLSVDAIIAAIAQLLEADPAALRTELMAAVRELVLTGVLRP